MAIDSILVPVDWSTSMEPVVKMADRLAILHDARLHLLHVVPVSTELAVSDGSAPNLFEPYPYENMEEAEKELLSVKQSLNHDADKIILHIDQGSPASQVLHQMEALDVDMVVLGTHGHGALYNLLVGSVTETILHHSKIPVMVIPAPKKD